MKSNKLVSSLTERKIRTIIVGSVVIGSTQLCRNAIFAFKYVTNRQLFLLFSITQKEIGSIAIPVMKSLDIFVGL